MRGTPPIDETFKADYKPPITFEFSVSTKKHTFRLLATDTTLNGAGQQVADFAKENELGEVLTIILVEAEILS